jgi:hypothetical protein
MAEEAAKLFGAVEGWLHSARGGDAGDAAAAHPRPNDGEPADAAEADAPTGAPHLGPECRVCPVCQLIHVVRGSRPELLEHLSVAATHLAQALRIGIETSEHKWTARRPDAGVERIDIG